MEVDPGLFDLIVQEGKDSIRIVNDGELVSLNVINSGRKRPEWSIEVVEGGQYLRGIQQTVYGQGRALVGDAVLPLPAPNQAEATGPEIAAVFPLTRDQTSAIASGASMGHAMQLSRDAPTFLGYRIDIPASASKRVGTFIRNCFKS